VSRTRLDPAAFVPSNASKNKKGKRIMATVSAAVRERYESIATTGQGDAWDLGRKAKQGDQQAAGDLAALLARAGFIEPMHIKGVYDAAAAGWAGRERIAYDARSGPGDAPRALWDAFWAFIEDEEPTDAAGFTVRSASLGGHLDAQFAERAIAASKSYDGVMEAAAQGWPDKFRLEDLARCPANSLGGEFHRLIVDNGFDLEVLDRDALGLSKLKPPLDYLNVRILQCHDLWHIIGGYRTTALHEVAISGFQLAQFGHNYSAQFLAVVTAKVSLVRPEGYPLMFETILSAWTHGRETPLLLGVDWPAIWNLPSEEIRARLGVTPYDSPFPADLFEQMRALQAAE
jgi:ubiquinone biosynthesis protein Coq4